MPKTTKPTADFIKTTGPLCFASLGECMVELSPAQTSGQFSMSFAGDAFNTLWYLKRLKPSWKTRFVSGAGQDAVSNDMLAMMDKAGVDTQHVYRSDTRSVGLYLISLDNGERSFSYWRDRSAARLLADDPSRLATALSDANVVYFSGITLAILDGSGREHLLSAVQDARRAGKTIAFDSNLRPRLWETVDHMAEYVMKAAELSDIVLPSYDDEALFFDDISISATRARYAEAGAKMVIVKNAGGAIHYLADGQEGDVTPPPAYQIVDTTSAGDSFNAGFFAGLSQFEDIQDAMLFASGVARQVIGQKGALVPIDDALFHRS